VGHSPPNPHSSQPVKGSIHNKGGAVDIPCYLAKRGIGDMGNDFEFFWKKGYQ